MKCNTHWSTWELALDLNTSQFTICCHLKKIGKMSKLGIWIPHTLSEKNKENIISIATSLLSRQRNDQFLKIIISDDEKWVSYDNVQRKTQWIDEDGISATHVYVGGITIVLLCVWWDHQGIYSFWVFKMQSDANCRHTLNSCNMWIKTFYENAPHLSIGKILCFL